MALTRNAPPGLATTRINPAILGPIILAALYIPELMAIAEERFSFSTIAGTNACLVGFSNASNVPMRKTRTPKMDNEICEVSVRIASSSVKRNNIPLVHKSNCFFGSRSVRTPAKRENKKTGRVPSAVIAPSQKGELVIV